MKPTTVISFQILTHLTVMITFLFLYNPFCPTSSVCRLLSLPSLVLQHPGHRQPG